MTKCLGCGAVLQNEDNTKEGYVSDLTMTLCERCFRIRNYGEYKSALKNNEYYLSILKDIEKTNDLVVLVTDFLNIASLSELKISNPILLVLAKRDLIPRNLDENKLLSKIKTKLNVIDRLTVGSLNNYNLDLLLSKINQYKTSNKVYVAGYTNAGKSTLINKLIKNYSDNKQVITTSILPSTTLDLIEVKLQGDLTIIDTPGLLDEGSIILNVTEKALKKILPKKEIKPIVLQIKTNQTLIIGDLFRLDVKKGTNLIFYLSNALKIERYYNEITKFQNESCRAFVLKANFDLVIKGLGFIKTTNDTEIKIYISDKVKIDIRESLI